MDTSREFHMRASKHAFIYLRICHADRKPRSIWNSRNLEFSLRTINPNEPVHRIPCLRHFWHFGCEAASDARSKRDAVTGDVRLRSRDQNNRHHERSSRTAYCREAVPNRPSRESGPLVMQRSDIRRRAGTPSKRSIPFPAITSSPLFSRMSSGFAQRIGRPFRPPATIWLPSQDRRRTCLPVIPSPMSMLAQWPRNASYSCGT
jgi:hypothetical protein